MGSATSSGVVWLFAGGEVVLFAEGVVCRLFVEELLSPASSLGPQAEAIKRKAATQESVRVDVMFNPVESDAVFTRETHEMGEGSLSGTHRY